MSEREYITLKDGTEVPADEFWLYAPMWLVKKFSETLPAGEPTSTEPLLANDALKTGG